MAFENVVDTRPWAALTHPGWHVSVHPSRCRPKNAGKNYGALWIPWANFKQVAMQSHHFQQGKSS